MALAALLLAGAAPAALCASTEPVSVDSAERLQEGGHTEGPLAVSGDGRIVLFDPSATNNLGWRHRTGRTAR